MFNHPFRSFARVGLGSSVLIACDTDRPRPVSIGCHQYVANKFIEDRIVVSRLEFGGKQPVQFIAVMDGHGGPQLAEYLTRKLPELMHRKLSDNVRISEAIKDTFLTADQEWYTTVKPVYDLGFTNPIKVGACAVAVAMDDAEIIVGSVGDCKCVLVRASGETVDLNIQRNANLIEEQDRLRKLHPGEDDVVRCKRSWQEPVEIESTKWKLPWTKTTTEVGQKTVFSGCYVKGRLQPTKSFGDFHLKSSSVEFDHERGRPFLDPENKKSFPYIDADPDVTITKRNRTDKYLIVGTDGLWDQFTSREAAGIVEAAISAGLTPDQAAIELVEAALMRAATNHKMGLVEMKALPPGSSRRNLHDDISVCIVVL
jgi:pyruvate dehydrogenase phosphatase